MSVSVCLSVTEVHWRIIDNLGFKFRSQFTEHFGRRACGREGRDHRREEWRDHLALCQPLLGALVICADENGVVTGQRGRGRAQVSRRRRRLTLKSLSEFECVRACTRRHWKLASLASNAKSAEETMSTLIASVASGRSARGSCGGG